MSDEQPSTPSGEPSDGAGAVFRRAEEIYFEVAGLSPADRAERNVRPTLVAGPLCESGDVFTQAAGGEALPRPLPQAAVGDLLVLHDTGAYGASMSSNYNSRPLAAEVLIDGDAVRLIRRRQTIDELLALERV